MNKRFLRRLRLTNTESARRAVKIRDMRRQRFLQKEIARELGTTRASVAKYLSPKSKAAARAGIVPQAGEQIERERLEKRLAQVFFQ